MRKDEFPIVDKLVNGSIIEELEKIKVDLKKEMEKLKGNSGCNYHTNKTIDNCIGTVTDVLDKHISELKGVE